MTDIYLHFLCEHDRLSGNAPAVVACTGDIACGHALSADSPAFALVSAGPSVPPHTHAMYRTSTSAGLHVYTLQKQINALVGLASHAHLSAVLQCTAVDLPYGQYISS